MTEKASSLLERPLLELIFDFALPIPNSVCSVLYIIRKLTGPNSEGHCK